MPALAPLAADPLDRLLPETRVWASADLARAGDRVSPSLAALLHLAEACVYDGGASGSPVYVNGDPVNLVDPNGHRPSCGDESDARGGCPWPQKGISYSARPPARVTQATCDYSAPNSDPRVPVSNCGVDGSHSDIAGAVPIQSGGPTVVLDIWVEDSKLCPTAVSGNFACTTSDNRGKSGDPDVTRSRVRITIDYSTGAAHVDITASCSLDLSGTKQTCHAPRDLVIGKPPTGPITGGKNYIDFSPSTKAPGRTVIELHALQAALPTLGTQATGVNNVFTLEPDASHNTVRLGGRGDAFPSFELIQNQQVLYYAQEDQFLRGDNQAVPPGLPGKAERDYSWNQ